MGPQGSGGSRTESLSLLFPAQGDQLSLAHGHINIVLCKYYFPLKELKLLREMVDSSSRTRNKQEKFCLTRKKNKTKNNWYTTVFIQYTVDWKLPKYVKDLWVHNSKNRTFIGH